MGVSILEENCNTTLEHFYMIHFFTNVLDNAEDKVSGKIWILLTQLKMILLG